MCAHGVEAVVAGQRLVEGLEQCEAGRRAVDHRRRHRAVERHHRVAGHPFQQPVEGEDLRPVRLVGGLRLVVHRRDRGLQLVFADRPLGSAADTSATPSAISALSHRARSCSASGTSSPAGPVRAGRRA